MTTGTRFLSFSRRSRTSLGHVPADSPKFQGRKNVLTGISGQRLFRKWAAAPEKLGGSARTRAIVVGVGKDGLPVEMESKQ